MGNKSLGEGTLDSPAFNPTGIVALVTSHSIELIIFYCIRRPFVEALSLPRAEADASLGSMAGAWPDPHKRILSAWAPENPGLFVEK